ncbi:MAG: hypothetical protein DMF60_21395 [Acidobacteria bacterium]|nr:MAG: hypothetical protein DMF60_21395 [Acidobacteriota bacterium]
MKRIDNPIIGAAATDSEQTFGSFIPKGPGERQNNWVNCFYDCVKWWGQPNYYNSRSRIDGINRRFVQRKISNRAGTVG